MMQLFSFTLGVVTFLLWQYLAELRRKSRRPPTKADILALRRALSVWAAKYSEANPTGKYFKRREAELYAACTRVGLMWIAPREAGEKGSAASSKEST